MNESECMHSLSKCAHARMKITHAVRAGTMRVFPGGLAVSRSIGDLELNQGLIIADPELYSVCSVISSVVSVSCSV